MIPRIPKDDRDNSFNYNDSFKYSTNDKEDFKGRHVRKVKENLERKLKPTMMLSRYPS